MMTEERSLLQQHLKSYLGLTPLQVEVLLPFFTTKEIEKGKHIVKVGQVYDQLTYITAGMLRVYAYQGKREVTQWIAAPGEFITDLNSLFFEGRAHRSIQAIEDSRLLSISGENYKQIKKEISEWHKVESRIIASCFITLENRIFNQISMSAQERYDHFYENRHPYLSSAPQQYIASMLGMTPETLSRIRSNKSLDKNQEQ